MPDPWFGPENVAEVLVKKWGSACTQICVTSLRTVMPIMAQAGNEVKQATGLKFTRTSSPLFFTGNLYPADPISWMVYSSPNVFLKNDSSDVKNMNMAVKELKKSKWNVTKAYVGAQDGRRELEAHIIYKTPYGSISFEFIINNQKFTEPLFYMSDRENKFVIWDDSLEKWWQDNSLINKGGRVPIRLFFPNQSLKDAIESNFYHARKPIRDMVAASKPEQVTSVDGLMAKSERIFPRLEKLLNSILARHKVLG